VTRREPSGGRRYPDRPVAGVGVVVWRGDKVLLVRRGRPPRQGQWGLPGGRQELGETIMEAAVREAREETGLEIKPLGVVTALDGISRDAGGRIEYHYTLIEVVAEADEGEARAASDATELRWAGLPEVETLCEWPEVARVVRLAALQRVL
jgi:ADP-ribose pyrophosphatase YjhB (NUDIX family)